MKEISIPTPDHFAIYGSLTHAHTPTEALVIFVHGLTGHKDEHIFFNGARFFNEHGYDAFRFNLYSYEDDARHFRDTSISVHAHDVETVVQYFNTTYKKIYLVGHSYGGTTLLLAKFDTVSALVFWDASYIDYTHVGSDFSFNESLNMYVLKDRVDYLVSKKFFDELKNFPDCGELVSRISIPKKFIIAGSDTTKNGERYMTRAQDPKEMTVIPNTDHCFNDFDSEPILFKETLDWIRKY